MELCLFDEESGAEIERITLPEYTDEIWHGYLPASVPARSTATGCTAPTTRRTATGSNPNKLLIDPYARDLAGEVQWSPAHFGYVLDAEDKDLSFSEEDSAPWTPKGRVTDPHAVEWGRDEKPRIPWGETIFYETHVRGFTKLHPAVPENLRGTFEGLGQKAVVDYVKSLGITAIELMPIHAFQDDGHLQAKGLSNYWGYNTMAFFAPSSVISGRRVSSASATWCAPSTTPTSR